MIIIIHMVGVEETILQTRIACGEADNVSLGIVNMWVIVEWEWEGRHKDDLSPNGLSKRPSIQCCWCLRLFLALIYFRYNDDDDQLLLLHGQHIKGFNDQMVLLRLLVTVWQVQWPQSNNQTIANTQILGCGCLCGRWYLGTVSHSRTINGQHQPAKNEESKMKNVKVKTKDDFSNLNFIIIPVRLSRHVCPARLGFLLL